jgi:acyl CoA:acetate/3-ketoacid CoA transferase
MDLVTEILLIKVTNVGLVLIETAPGISVEGDHCCDWVATHRGE